MTRAPHEEVLRQLRRIERDELSLLLTRIDGAHEALRRDDDGEWWIIGGRGHIKCCNGMFTAHVTSQSKRHWAYAKRALDGLCTVTAAYGDEGSLRLDRMPQGDEADKLRHAIGLRATRPAATADRLRRPALDREGVA